MKIVDQKVFVANVARTNLVFVKLYTDEGIEGVGEATLEWKTETVVGALSELKRYLIGKDPFQVDLHIETMHRDSYWRDGAVFRSALGGVEAAMLDIKGKALGVPVYELLGGRQRDSVQCYGNHWFFGAVTPEDHARLARAAVDQGLKALKWDPLGSASLELNHRQRMTAVEIVEAVRSEVGEDVDLMLDLHGRLNVPSSIALARDMEPFNLRWIEEPTPPDSIDALVEVRRNSRVPIAAGERYYVPDRFMEAIAKNAVDVLQPDVSHCGGMAVAKWVAGLAHNRMIPVAPHNPTGPVMNAMTLHLSLAIPNFSIFEMVMIDAPWRKEIVRESIVFEDGAILAPTAPGLGVEIDEDACGRFPYQPTDVPLFDGSMNVRGIASGDSVLGRK